MHTKAVGDRKSVQVVVRVRPQCHLEDKLWVEVINPTTLQTLNHRNSAEALHYEFGHVFGTEASQKQIYETCVKQLLSQALDGKNASVFAYGPTGAGKTHTILGTAQEPGIIPRTIKDLFFLAHEKCEELHKVGEKWDFNITFSYVEIYQEKVFDLLKSTQKDLPIREDGQKNIFVAGLSEQKIESVQEFNDCFGPASKNRTTAATRLNERSSRSHSILMLKVMRRLTVPPHRTLTGKLHIIDLAGSEDNRRTGNKGVRLKESGAINASLLALGQVVEALNRNAACVPYRSSRLTRLLQDSLGGSAATCMIVNLSPEERHYFDTYTTLHFARKTKKIVNNVQVNETFERVASKRKVSTEIADTSLTKKSKPETPPRPITPPVTPPVEIPQSFLSPFVRQQKCFKDEVLNRLESLEVRLLSQIIQPQTDPNKSGDSPQFNTAHTEIERLKEDLLQVKTEITTKHTAKGPPARLKTYLDGSIKEGIPALTASPLFVRPTVLRRRQGKSTATRSRDTGKENTSSPTPQLAPPTINSEAQLAHNTRILELLNAGTVKELQALQTVGQKKAQLIFDWRTLHGSFSAITDLKNVVGISEKNMNNFLQRNMIQL